MPALSRWAIRAALLYLLLGFTAGGLMLLNKGFPAEMARLWPGLMRWLPVHIELLFTGWMVQFTLGVSYWILPRKSDRPHGRYYRGNENMARVAFLLLNAGIWLVLLSGWLVGEWWLLTGRVLEAAAVVLFALHAWPRVIPYLS